MTHHTNYSPILSPFTKETFFDYVRFLKIPYIDYIAIGIQNLLSKTSISLMSSLEWQKCFIDNQYAVYDPVRRAAFFTKRNIIPFDEIDCIDSFGKEIMQHRVRMNIKNGFILMRRFKEFNYMITLGTGFSKFKVYDFITKYHQEIFMVKKDLIDLMAKDAREFVHFAY